MTRKLTQLRGLIPFVALPLFCGCQDGVTDPEDPVLDAQPLGEYGGGFLELMIVPGNVDLAVGDYLELERVWRDGDEVYDDPQEDIRWVSDDPDIASVTEDGLVRALAEGTVRIRAEAKGVWAEAMVNVR